MLARVLAEGDTTLLADLIGAATAAGARAPVALLPALLDAGVDDRALRPTLAASLGERGRWLARFRDDWLSVATAGTAAAVAEDPRLWETGSRAERAAYLAGLRHDDPDRAREVLTEAWPRESGADREYLLGLLAVNLSPADEPFLESTLDDRKASVGRVAARLLTALPGSAYRARALARGRPLLRSERHALRRRLVAEIPEPAGADAVRDGVDPKPRPGVGAGAWLLVQLLANVPLGEWTARFAMQPEALADLPVDGGLGPVVHAGWRLAAVRQRDPAWAAALVAASDRDPAAGGRPGVWTPDERLLEIVPVQARLDRVIRLAAHSTQQAVRALADCPGPWPDRAADVLLRHIAAAEPAQVDRRAFAEPLHAAARCLPATGPRDYAAELRSSADDYADNPLGALLRRCASTIELRRRFLEELP